MRARVAAAIDWLRAPAATEEYDLVAADLGRVALVAVLVVPLPRLQTAFHVDLLALGEVLRQRFRRLAPQHHAVPFGFFLPLAGLVVPHLGGRHVDRRDGGAARRVAQLGVASEVPDEDDFVHASHKSGIVHRPATAASSDRAAASLESPRRWPADT